MRESLNMAWNNGEIEKVLIPDITLDDQDLKIWKQYIQPTPDELMSTNKELISFEHNSRQNTASTTWNTNSRQPSVGDDNKVYLEAMQI